MDFFGMGMGEILLILVVALLIWGPSRIVEIGRTLGKLTSTLRKASTDLTTQITREVEGEAKSPPPQSKASHDNKTEETTDADTVEPADTETTSPRDR
jgi:sec-independent protein translocase protein TatA